MKFSKMESQARELVLARRGEEVELGEVWLYLGKEAKGSHWRTKASQIMRNVCLKSLAIPPEIERTTPLGRGAKARYRART